MSPEQLCAKGTESGHQKALFAWAAMAQQYGFSVANDMETYKPNPARAQLRFYPVPALRWLHSIPNGGARDPITAARMKAEGIKSGVADIFLPVASCGHHGLYIEMKEPGRRNAKDGGLSKEQAEFYAWCNEQQYAFSIAYTWREAANTIERYLT